MTNLNKIFSMTRMLIKLGLNGKPDQIVAIFMRQDLDTIVTSLKGKYK
jgi:hypothetical protein